MITIITITRTINNTPPIPTTRAMRSVSSTFVRLGAPPVVTTLASVVVVAEVVDDDDLELNVVNVISDVVVILDFTVVDVDLTPVTDPATKLYVLHTHHLLCMVNQTVTVYSLMPCFRDTP